MAICFPGNVVWDNMAKIWISIAGLLHSRKDKGIKFSQILLNDIDFLFVMNN